MNSYELKNILKWVDGNITKSQQGWSETQAGENGLFYPPDISPNASKSVLLLPW